MAAQYELLKELLNSGTKLSFGQDFFFKFYQAFLLKDRWMQYISGVGTTLLVTALALALGVVLGSVVALVRVTHDQQRPGLKVLDTSYAEEDYAIGMAKGSALEDAVNKALEELKADGTLQAIVDKYINAN